MYDNRAKNTMKVFAHSKDETNSEENEKETAKINLETKENVSKEVTDKLNWKYPKIELTKTEGKASVSKIAKQEEIKYMVEPIKPQFMKENTKLSGSKVGTLVHLVLQKLDFNKEYELKDITELLEKLETKKIITKAEKESVPKEKILAFTKTNIFKRLKTAKEVQREKPFYINIPAGEIYENNLEEKILVQGIIDLYFIDENGNVVLVDYKTDYVPNEDETYLIAKYKKQLRLYARALKEALEKDVKEIYIYSTYLNKEITLDQ